MHVVQCMYACSIANTPMAVTHESDSVSLPNHLGIFAIQHDIIHLHVHTSGSGCAHVRKWMCTRQEVDVHMSGSGCGYDGIYP